MKSKINDRMTESTKCFPKLMKSNNKDTVIFFTKKDCGMVVFIGEKNALNYNLGEYSEDWAMECFSDFDESVRLWN